MGLAELQCKLADAMVSHIDSLKSFLVCLW